MAGTTDLPPVARAPLLFLGFLALLVGMAGGLARQGFGLMASGPAWAYHGVLMVGGFFGTVIALERAVALGSLWAYAGPLAAGSGALLLLAGFQGEGAALLFMASLLLTAASLIVWEKQPTLFSSVIALGAMSWAMGTLLWLLGWRVVQVLPWWLSFFVMTIAGERLELNRLLRPKPGARRLFVVIACAILLGTAASAVWPRPGVLLLAGALAAMALWLFVNDIARRTVKGKGLPRYVAVSLLSGYFWLLTGASAILAGGGLTGGGALYDAAVHAILVGFVFSMVFGHAPIIFPAVLRVNVPYTPWLYLPLVLLHLTLALRLLADAAAWRPGMVAGGLGNASSVLLFIVTMAGAVLLHRIRHRRVPDQAVFPD